MTLLEIEPDDIDISRAPVLEVEPEPERAAAPQLSDPELVIEPQQAETALARQSSDLVSQAKALVVTDPATFERAGAFLETLKTQQRQIEEFFEADIQRAHAAWKGLTTKRASYVDPLKEAIAIVSSRYAAFAREERARAEKERRDREEAARRAEQERLQAEAKAREAEARRLEDLAMAASTREEGQALQQQAELALTEANDIKVEAATVEAPVLAAQPSVAPPKGTTIRANWTFEVTDRMALCKAIAAGEVSIEAFTPSETYLRSRARADKDTCRIPGVRVYDAGSVAHRRTR
jgi:hypothetical protein